MPYSGTTVDLFTSLRFFFSLACDGEETLDPDTQVIHPRHS